VSAADVLAGTHPPAVFRNAIVFVGTTALGTREVVSTPLDTRFAGVEVQATVADNLLRRDFLRRPENALTLEVVTVLALGIAITLLVGRVGLKLGAVAGAISWPPSGSPRAGSCRGGASISPRCSRWSEWWHPSRPRRSPG
jgi:adenylate cyclase